MCFLFREEVVRLRRGRDELALALVRCRHLELHAGPEGEKEGERGLHMRILFKYM